MADKNRLLELALKGLEAERAKLDDEINQIKSQLKAVFHSDGATADFTGSRKRRRMSAAARKKISESMKRRYAEMRKALKKAA